MFRRMILLIKKTREKILIRNKLEEIFKNKKRMAQSRKIKAKAISF